MRAYKSMLAAALISLPVAALADGGMKSAGHSETVYSHMTFSGLDFSKDSWATYNGAIFALNRDLSRDGVMVRIMGSYGKYEYDNTVTHDVKNWQGDVMIGYQWVRDRVEVSLYAGVDVINHNVTPFDAFNRVSGHETGFKVAGDIETRTTSLNLPYYFLLDGSYSTAFDTYYAIGRLGLYRNNVIFGVEGWLLGYTDWDAQRLGGFVQWERNLRPDLLVDVTLSAGYQFSDDDAGACGVGCGRGSSSEGAYATLNMSFYFGDRRSKPLK